MQYGRQRAEWDRVSALIVHLRSVFGDGQTKFEHVHPHYADVVRQENRRAFKALSRAAQEKQNRAKEN